MSQSRDRVLQCADCGGTFVFTAGEQAFYQERGFSEPRRCPTCRQARKAGRPGAGQEQKPRERSGRRERPPREMHDAICADCGQPTQVPFVPRDDRPIYCKDCYEKRNY